MNTFKEDGSLTREESIVVKSVVARCDMTVIKA
jgi:hypothetical protein